MKAKEGDVETGDAASELQKEIQNDESIFIKMFVLPKFKHLQKQSKTEEKKMSLRDLLPMLMKSEERNATRDIPIVELKEEEKNSKNDESMFIKMFVLPKFKLLQNQSETEEKKMSCRDLLPVSKKSEERNTTRDIPIMELKEEEKNSKNDGPVKLKRSNTFFGQIIKFIEDLPDWLKYAIAALAFIMYPLYRQLRKKEDEMQESVQSLLQVVERVAEVTEKLANDIAEALPSGNSLKGAVETVSKIAQKVDKDAETAQAFVKMIDDLGDELDEYINPLVKIGDAFIKDQVEEKKTKTESKDLELALDAKL